MTSFWHKQNRISVILIYNLQLLIKTINRKISCYVVDIGLIIGYTGVDKNEDNYDIDVARPIICRLRLNQCRTNVKGDCCDEC